MRDDVVSLKLRFREKLRRKIEKAAKRKSVSMNSEIIERLEASFSKDDASQLIDVLVETNIMVASLYENFIQQDKVARDPEVMKRLALALMGTPRPLDS